jgi:hypothetical protein
VRVEPPPGHPIQSADAESFAEKLLFDHYRRMTPREKAAMLSDMCRGVNQLMMAGLRQRHPGLDEAALELKAAALRLGRDKVLEITGIDPDSLDGSDPHDADGL